MSKNQTDIQKTKIKRRTAGETEIISGGRYFGDYSPLFEEKYDIYEKAKMHMKKVKKENRRANKEENLETTGK